MKLKKLSILLAATSLILVGCGDSPAPQPPHEHEWGDPTYLWAQDYSNCTATRVCLKDRSHVQTETKQSVETITPAGCETSGEKSYKVTFTNNAFEEQIKSVTLDPLGHDWGTPTYEWSSDNLSCTATRVCSRDSSHKESETKGSSYSVITSPTEAQSGLGRYTVEFDNSAFASQSKDVVISPLGPSGDIETFVDAINSINARHNYSAHLNNQWANESEPFADFNYFNINDDVMFDDFDTYFYSGYIKQKGQGIVNFQLNKSATSTGGLILGYFKSTNVDRSVSDVYSLAVEHLIAEEFIYDEDLGLYKSTSMKAMAILANLAFGDYTSLVSAPEYITAKFENDILTFQGIYEVTYFDVEEVHTTADVTLKVSNIEKTHNEILEGYVINPDYTYVAPTEWDKDTSDLFKEEFNGVIPPFIEGMSYAWKAGRSVSEGFYVAMVEDYFAGDLTSGYRVALEAIGFHEVSNPGLIEYQKIVEEEDVIHTYSVKMRYYSPEEKDSSGMKYGYLYPNGISSFKFLHKQKTKGTIVTVGLLNDYIGKSLAGEYLPKFDLDADTKVANFNDASATSEDMVILYKGTEGASDGAYFRIYADTKNHAVEAVNKFISDLRKLGFSGSSSASFQQYWMSDDYFSQIRITDPSYATAWTDKTYLQVRIEITQASIDYWKEQSITLDSISVSGQTLVWTEDDEFIFDGVVTAKYSSGYEEKVTPTEVSSPDMSKTGTQDVTVKYKNSKDEEVFYTYQITINAKETKYNISYTQPTGATISVIYPPSGQAAANSDVVLEVIPNDGYQVNKVTATSGDKEIEVTGPIPSTSGNVGYTFKMPAGDVTISADVSAVVVYHNISYVIKDVDTLETLSYDSVIGSGSSLPKSAEEGSLVNFVVSTKTGYSVNFLQIGTTVLPNAPYSTIMGDSDIVVEIYVKDEHGGEDVFGGEYSTTVNMSTPGYYFKYTLIFNSDGTGSYVRERYTPTLVPGDTKTLTFTWSSSGSSLILTFKEGENTDFTNNYRLFPRNKDKSDPSDVVTNTTGVIVDNNNVTISLYSSSGTIANTLTFTKA